jgi:hypothetical protein
VGAKGDTAGPGACYGCAVRFWWIALGLSLSGFAAEAQAQPAPPAGNASPSEPASPPAGPSTKGPSPPGVATPDASPLAGPADGATAPAPLRSYPPSEELRPIAPGELWREEEREPRDMRYPGYFAAGLITLGAGVGLAVGSVVSAFEGDDRAAIGLGALATIAWGTGIALTLLGATPDPAGDSATAYAGIALATTGVLSLGLGGTLWAAREGEKQEDPDNLAPLVLVAGGGAALVAGVITWAVGASRDDDDDRAGGLEAELVVGPARLGLQGRF